MGLCILFYELYVVFGVKMVDFGGWDMLLYYGLQVEEYYQVWCDCGVFDVFYMIVVDVVGEQVMVYLQYFLVNDVVCFGEIGKVFYSVMFNEEGGVVDDLIVYLIEYGYWVVVNVFICDKDIVWMQVQVVGFKVDLQECGDLVMFVIQGFNVCVYSFELVFLVCVVLICEFKLFQGCVEGDWFIVCIGYIGEDGLEIMLLVVEVLGFFNELVGVGIFLVGLGVCDMLCLEVGFNFYGQDMDESVFLFVVNMGWIVVWELVVWDFVGCCVLEVQKVVGDQLKLVGLVLEECGVLCVYQVVWVVGIGEGEIISGSFLFILNKFIVLVCVLVVIGDCVEVEICGKWYLVWVVQFSFVCYGKFLI